jgi:4-amino-4-deoxy-L-arabinose transferase-like glycosyltransferase
LFALAVCVRLAAVLAFRGHPLTGLTVSDNATEYYLPIARNLLAGRPYNTAATSNFAKIPPAYPFMIAAVFRVFGENLTALRGAQCFLDSLTVVVMFLVAKELFGTGPALVTGLMVSFYPFTVYFCLGVDQEPLFTFLLSSFALALLVALRLDRWHLYGLAGALLGLTTLTRATTQLFPLAILPLLLWFRGANRRTLAKCGAFAGAFLLLIVPWALRNYFVLHDFIPVASGVGSVFLQGSDEKFFTIESRSGEYATYFAGLRAAGIVPPPNAKESEIDHYIMRAGLERYKERLKERPLSLFPLMFKKFMRLWYGTDRGWHEGKILLVHMAILPLAVWGVILAYRRAEHRERLWFVLVLVGYFVGLHWVLLPLARYMVPVMLYLISFEAYALAAVARAVLGRTRWGALFRTDA